MSLSFASFWPLLLLPVVLYLVWVRRHTDTSLSSRHLRVLTGVRIWVTLLLILALMRPTLNRPGHGISVLYLVDVSRSIAPEFLRSAIRWAEQASELGQPEHARYIGFASHPTMVETAEALGALAVYDGFTSRPGAAVAPGAIDQSKTNIERALRQAITGFAPHRLRRLVLISDGHETEGELSNAIGELEEQGIRVFTLPAAVRADGDAWVEAVEVAEDVCAKELVAVEVVVFNRAETRGVVELETSNGDRMRRELALRPGLNRIPFEIRMGDPGALELTTRVRAEGDPFPDNDERRRSLSVGPAPRILYVEGYPPSARYLRQALESEGLEVASRSVASLAASPNPWEEYDAVILSDVSPDKLDETRMSSLESYVRDGAGGFIFAAGETSYGEEGYSNSVVERILPVDFRVEEKWKDLSLIIVLDKSYSMYGRKIALAKEATKAALDLLEETHRFGVVTFDWNPYTTIPLQLATNKDWIKDGISRIQASAQTNIYPALERAFEQLEESPSKVKHVILLSDGKTYPDDYEELVERMTEGEITLSTVAVGEEADRELLANIASWGNGRSYFIEDAERVQQIFIEETQIALEATLVEESFHPLVKRRTEALRGIDFDAAPELKGYVSTKAKDSAEVLIEAADEDPLLVRWHYGIGTAVMFTSDVKNRWATEWLHWDGYGKFWSQLVRETMRRDHGPEVDFRVMRKGDQAQLVLRLVDEEGLFPKEILPEVEVIDPNQPSGRGGRVRRISLPQRAPGLYQTTVALTHSSEAPWRFQLVKESLPASLRASAPEARSLDLSYPDEYRFYHADVERLRFLSERTGGKFQPEMEEVFADLSDRASVPTNLWPWFLGLALLLYLMDIALRRAPWLWERLEMRVAAKRTAGSLSGS